MKRRIAVTIASIALCLGGLVVAQAGAATKTVSASGGLIRFAATVRNAKTCSWSSRPRIAGFAKTVKCNTGNVARSAKFSTNTSTAARSYVVALTVRGKTTTADHWKVTQAGEITTTTTPALTTTTTAAFTRVLLTIGSGSGDATLPFVVPVSDLGWEEQWSYDCSNVAMKDSFLTKVVGTGSNVGTTDSGVNEFGLTDTGANYYSDTGTFTIDVISPCHWVETIYALIG